MIWQISFLRLGCLFLSTERQKNVPVEQPQTSRAEPRWRLADREETGKNASGQLLGWLDQFVRRELLLMS